MIIVLITLLLTTYSMQDSSVSCSTSDTHHKINISYQDIQNLENQIKTEFLTPDIVDCINRNTSYLEELEPIRYRWIFGPYNTSLIIFPTWYLKDISSVPLRQAKTIDVFLLGCGADARRVKNMIQRTSMTPEDKQCLCAFYTKITVQLIELFPAVKYELFK